MNSAVRIDICAARTVGMRSHLELPRSHLESDGVPRCRCFMLLESGAWGYVLPYTPVAMASASLPLKCWTGMLLCDLLPFKINMVQATRLYNLLYPPVDTCGQFRCT